MKTKFSDKGFDAAEKRLKQAGKDCINAGAAEMQQVAQREARVDSGALRRGIVLLPTENGAHVVSTMSYSRFVEEGTGRYTPGGRSTPWVYYSSGYGFVTTTGMPASPFMKPGFDAGVQEFHKQKRRRGL